jgi:hypothetical protein
MSDRPASPEGEQGFHPATHQVIFRLPRTLLSPQIAEQSGVDGHGH